MLQIANEERPNLERNIKLMDSLLKKVFEVMERSPFPDGVEYTVEVIEKPIGKNKLPVCLALARFKKTGVVWVPFSIHIALDFDIWPEPERGNFITTLAHGLISAYYSTFHREKKNVT